MKSGRIEQANRLGFVLVALGVDAVDLVERLLERLGASN